MYILKFILTFRLAMDARRNVKINLRIYISLQFTGRTQNTKQRNVVKFNKISTQRSIRYTESKFYNEIPEKITSSFYLSQTTFVS